jgi:outer membrane protein OmpA-like peptidoglycan-associated protein
MPSFSCTLSVLRGQPPGVSSLDRIAVRFNAWRLHSSRQLRSVKAGRLVLTAAICLLAIAGCGKTVSAAPQDVVVVASATANEPAPVLSVDNRNLLYAVGEDSVNGTAFVVNPNTGQPSMVSLTPRRGDGQVEYAEPRRQQLLGANVDQVQQVLNREAATGPFDLLNDIAAGVRVAPGPGTLLVISSGVSTSGGFNLVDVGWGADPQTVAAQLKSRHLLPNLSRWRVIFSGLADTAGLQAALPLPQRATLAAYWMAICQAANAASCQIDEMTRPEPPPHSMTQVPPVPVPEVTSVRGPDGWRGENLPDDEFFAFGRAELLPGADGILDPLASQARSSGSLVSITGYSSPDGGSSAYNIALSKARAMAVRNRLITLGVPASQIVQTVGLGTDGKTLSDCYSDGQFEESSCAQLRRVVVLLSLAPAAHS